MTYLCWKMAGGVGTDFMVSPTSTFAWPHSATGTIVLVFLIPRNPIIIFP